ncbi:MAG TPA: hypothetical protein VFX37_04215 [Pseudolabrys sp.]|nr:hypothetical protein [Pseudolabrys sp.]
MAATTAPVSLGSWRLCTRRTGAAMAGTLADGMRTRPRLMHGSRTVLHARLNPRPMLADRMAAVHGAPLDRLPMMPCLADGVLPHTLVLSDPSAMLLLSARSIVLLRLNATFVP